MKKLLFAVLTAGLFAACTQEAESGFETQEVNDGIKAIVTVKSFTPSNSTRTAVDEDGSVWWKTGDRMGMFAHDVTIEENSNSTQTAFTLAGVLDTHSAAFTGGIGWHMLMDGKHKYFAYFPFDVYNTHNQIVLEYPTKYVFSSNDSREHLGQYDYMYSKMVSPINKERAAFEFEHINALAKFDLAIPEDFRDSKFRKMTITADDSIFTETATYSVSSIVEKGEPEVVQTSKTNMIEVEFSGDGVSATDGTLTTWLMMFPTDLKDKKIKIKLYGDNCITLPLLTGEFSFDSNQQSGEMCRYSIPMTECEWKLPERPNETEHLNILLFGHSYGVDCTEQLPAITVAAGVNNVHFGRFYAGNCSMEQHYNNWKNNVKYTYYDCKEGTTSWPYTDRTSKEVIAETPWDIIIFQTNHSYVGAGDYSSYREPFRNLVNEILSMCEAKHGKKPLIGYNMFWSETDANDIDGYKMYTAIAKATKEMIQDTGFEFIIAPGTALQNARNTSLNVYEVHNFLRDGYHASYGIGSYVCACTWFQTVIAPIYGKNIIGNNYRPTNYSFEGDQVTDATAAILQKCAVAAVVHPFEVTTIEE